MKISRNWLQTFFDKELPDAATLADALTFHAFEIEAVEQFRPPVSEFEDQVLDVKVTPNRGHDALSHRGIAKEVSAILNVPMRVDPLREKVSLEPKTDSVTVEIENPELCSRYIAAYIQGLKVGPSPDWLRASLESIGQKSSNNVVDATNFIMFSLGQPLHAFDADKVKGMLIVRTQRGAEDVDLLRTTVQIKGGRIADYRRTIVGDQALVVADDSGPIALAGLIGGDATRVTNSTTNLIIESANFSGPIVRRSSRVFGIRTDASDRFQQSLSPELASHGMRAAVDLIIQIAGGELVGFADEYPALQKAIQVSVTTSRINALLGTSLLDEDVVDVFERLGLPFEKKGDEFVVTHPFDRLDLLISEDLVEEVARIVGYEKIPATELPPFPNKPEINPNFYWQERIRSFLLSQGFSEVFTSVFVDKSPQFSQRVVLNKVSGEKPYLRADLLNGLQSALESNVRNKDLLGLRQVRIFEIGTVWLEDSEQIALGLGVEPLKGQKTASDFLRALGDDLGINVSDEGGHILSIVIDSLIRTLPEPTTYEDFPISEGERYEPFSKYPFIVRDIAMWVPEGPDAISEILSLFGELGGPLLRHVELFDQFKKDERMSYAFHLVFQSFEKTLTDAEANDVMSRITVAVEKRGW